MEHPEQYYNRDMWPPENDRALMFRLASDVPVLQNTLIRIFVIGLSKVIIKYRVSQEECARLRESVPYVKLYRYNPKHLYPKLNGYGDNGQRSLKL